MTRLIEITGKVIAGEWGEDDLAGEGIPVLRTTNFTNIGVVNYDNIVTRIIKKKNLKDKLLRYGDIIIEKSGGSDTQPVGRVIFFEGEEEKYLFNNFTGLLRVKNRNLWNPKYVFYTLFANYAKGMTVPYENRTTGLHNLQTDSYINATEVINRGINEQNKIVYDIDKVVELVNLHKKQLKDLDIIIKSRFIEMFGNPVTDSKNLGFKPLRGFIKNIRYGTSTPPVFSDYGFSFIRATNIKNGKVDNKDMKYIGQEEANKIPKCKLFGGEMIIVRSGVNAGDTCIIDADNIGNYAGYDIIIVFNESVNPVYINELINTHYMDMVVKPLTRRAAQPHLNSEQVQNLPIVNAPIELQNQFADFVAQVDKSKLAVQQSLNELETLKKSLMQQYFG